MEYCSTLKEVKMKKINTKTDKTGGTWDTYQAGNTKIQTHTSKKGDTAVFHNGKKLNPKKGQL